MPWIYVQKTGGLWQKNADTDGTDFLVAYGYSGHDAGVNNPDMQEVHEIGPIPCGTYTINPPQDTPKHGPFVLALTPDPTNNMFGRDGLLIHGDSVHYAGQHQASHGCIILARAIREKIWNSQDHTLTVQSS
jgi:hypothetical protein